MLCANRPSAHGREDRAAAQANFRSRRQGARPSRGSRRRAPFASTDRLHRSHAIALLADAELTWLEDDGEDDDAGDEEAKDAMTEAKDEPDVDDASSSACGVMSEGRKTN